jgi:uncharacterized protein YbdZ (MbtH family)
MNASMWRESIAMGAGWSSLEAMKRALDRCEKLGLIKRRWDCMKVEETPKLAPRFSRDLFPERSERKGAA